MPADTTPLAQRLTHRTAAAIYGAAYGKATMRKAERAVVAVLREVLPALADVALKAELPDHPAYSDGWFDAYSQVRDDLTALADSIEKGGASE